jgi:coenzyme A diphosphatase NUDT7
MDLELLKRRLRNHGGGDGADIRAAVVVPLREGPQGWEVLFELRPMHLSQSPGEVSFPGGRLEAGEGPREAALRELEEELGVSPAQTLVLGQLRTRQRRRGEFIYPFVCLLDPAAPIRPQETEVEELFSIPVNALLSLDFGEARIVEEYTLSENFPKEYLPAGRWRGRQERPVYFFRYDRFFIWGLTASILLDLLSLLRPEAARGGWLEEAPAKLPPGSDGQSPEGWNSPGIFGENP